MQRFEAIQKAAEDFTSVIENNTRPGRTRDSALEMVRKAVERANRAIIVDKLRPATEGQGKQS